MFSSIDYLTLPLMACIAVALDGWLGEPKRGHPLVAFGRWAARIEQWLNPTDRQPNKLQRFAGLLAVGLATGPWLILATLLCHLSVTLWSANIYLLYFALGHKSLHQHARAVSSALAQGDGAAANLAASRMVSRDAEAIEPVPATIESVLENGNDGVFGALFWFFVAGGVGALAYRLINTLDAMWGYKTTRHLYFGWAAARLDDVLNWLPARLTALTYALLGHTRLAFRCWWQQGTRWKSPNAGPVMAAGAGALHIQLGGKARYHGVWQERPTLGHGEAPVMEDIERALSLVRHGVYRWLIIGLLCAATFG